MKLRDLRWEDDPGLPGWAQRNLAGPYKGKREMVGSESEKRGYSDGCRGHGDALGRQRKGPRPRRSGGL